MTVGIAQNDLERLRLPVIGAPMFLCSGPDLVIAQSRAGICGTFPALNARRSVDLDDWLTRIDDELTDSGGRRPYGVNLILYKSNERLAPDLDVITRHRVPLVITSLAAPTDIVGRVHEYGGMVFHDVTTVRHARKAAQAGVDGLILVCAGAGGHGGSLNPFAFVVEVKRFFSGRIILAGPIGNGADIVAAQALGCDLVYMGTRFLVAEECMANIGHKEMVIDADASSIVYTPRFSGVHANYLRESIVAAGLNPDACDADARADFRPGKDKPKAWKDICGAGQGVGTIDAVEPVSVIVDRLAREYSATRDRLMESQAQDGAENVHA